MADPMREAHNLRRTFKDLVAVAGISFGVRHGDIFGLLGLNGAGKTTTIRDAHGPDRSERLLVQGVVISGIEG